MHATAEDRKICRELLRSERWITYRDGPPGDLVAAVAASFVGFPYAARPLEGKGPERLVINLREVDCVTFVEQAIALARCIRKGSRSFADFAASVRALRYRNGRLEGYPSRLHYISDWFFDNQKKGLIRDVTREMGGLALRKTISFMTAHADRFPALRRRPVREGMADIERACSERPIYHIPRERVRGHLLRIAHGDVIAFTTDTEGLDVSHMGIAAYHLRGLHLLHASEREGRVVISKETLWRYAAGNKSRTGILVARVL